MVKYLKTMEEFNAMLTEEAGKLSIIDFTATWCGPCQMIAPIYQAMSEEHTDCNFYKVDVDESEEIAQACDISAMPTFQFFKGGKKVDDFCGASKDMILQRINKHK